MGHADINATVEEDYDVDTFHADVSEQVIVWSKVADTTISSWLGYEDNTTVCKVPNKVKHESKEIDAFFQNDKYFNETANTFIRLRTDSHFQSKVSSDFNLKLSAQLGFNKCQEQFKFFAENMTLNRDKQADTQTDNDNPDIGIRYFAVERYGIEPSYSLGLNGIHPFVSARYSMSFNANTWEIDPIQTFKYSSNDAFREETNIYFDKALDKESLFRLNLHRATGDDFDGMNYGLTLQYYLNSKQDIGFRFSQSFFGNTKYKTTLEKSVDGPQIKEYSGINNYVSSLSFRAKVWRPWFYYELRPSVNFHRDYDYEPNYSVRLFFDFYFGNYH